jgi:hemolysin III
MIDRVETVAEEFASSISHGIGLVGSIAALPVLVLATRRHQDPWLMTGVVVFGSSLVILYLASTLYHALPPSKAKRVCRVLDHSAIYLLIAGTYAPFTLGPLRGPWGYTLLVVVWTLALLGIAVKAKRGAHAGWFSTAVYLTMGWLAIVAMRPMFEQLPTIGIVWLLAGGMCYTTGVVFFVMRRLPFSHFIWHLMVLAGSVFHVLAVLHAAPPAIR